MRKGQRIRSYVLHPHEMVIDHRTGVRTNNARSVLDGDLDMFIEANLRHDIRPPIRGAS